MTPDLVDTRETRRRDGAVLALALAVGAGIIYACAYALGFRW